MNHNNAFLASVLNHGHRALAGYAAGELLESQPETGSRLGSDPLSAWQDWIAARLKELASAVAAEDPRVFTGQVRWAKSLLAVRGFSTEHFELALKCLRETLTRELPQSVRPLAAEYLDRALDSFHDDPADLSTHLGTNTPESRLASQYLLAVLEGDRRLASRLILDGLEQGHSIEDLFIRVLLPAQVEIGRMWHADEINVAEEHFVSETTKMVMAQLMSRAEYAPSNGRTMLTAAVAGNQIDIGLQAVAHFFELDGWRTIHLGADVPVSDIVQVVGQFEADLLGLSASQSTQLETTRATIDAVRSSSCGEDVKIIVGGFAFAGLEHLPLQFGANGYAPDPAAAVHMGDTLCSTQ